MRLEEHDLNGIAPQVLALDPGWTCERLMLPLVCEHEIDVSEREHRERLLRLRLDELEAEIRRGATELLHRGNRKVERRRLEGGDSASAGDLAGGGGQVGLRELRSIQERLRVTDEHQRRIGQPDTPARPLEQANARFPLEHRKLLRDGRGREPERLGYRGDGPANVQLAQETQPVEIEHSEATLTS
jgi:hypothetical protein